MQLKIISKILRIKDILSSWFSYFNICKKCYDFDYSSIYLIEQHQIKRVRNSINKYRSHVNWKRDVTHMDLAIKLLDIILSCDSELAYVNTKNATRFIPNFKYLKNRDFKLFEQDLYIEKAKSLYYKLRHQYTTSWWD